MFKNGWIIEPNQGRYLHLRDNTIRTEKVLNDKIHNVHFAKNTEEGEIGGTLIKHESDEKSVTQLSGKLHGGRRHSGIHTWSLN
jgi:hypothetical protein